MISQVSYGFLIILTILAVESFGSNRNAWDCYQRKKPLRFFRKMSFCAYGYSLKDPRLQHQSHELSTENGANYLDRSATRQLMDTLLRQIDPIVDLPVQGVPPYPSEQQPIMQQPQPVFQQPVAVRPPSPPHPPSSQQVAQLIHLMTQVKQAIANQNKPVRVTTPPTASETFLASFNKLIESYKDVLSGSVPEDQTAIWNLIREILKGLSIVVDPTKQPSEEDNKQLVKLTEMIEEIHDWIKDNSGKSEVASSSTSEGTTSTKRVSTPEPPKMNNTPRPVPPGSKNTLTYHPPPTEPAQKPKKMPSNPTKTRETTTEVRTSAKKPKVHGSSVTLPAMPLDSHTPEAPVPKPAQKRTGQSKWLSRTKQSNSRGGSRKRGNGPTSGPTSSTATNPA